MNTLKFNSFKSLIIVKRKAKFQIVCIRQQLTTCWPQNFKPQIKYIVKKKRKKKKNLEKYYIIITKNEWIVVLFLRQILYSFFWRGDIYDWRDLLKYCTGIPTTMGKNAKKSAIYHNLLPFNARSSKNLSNNSFIPFWRTVLNIGTAWPADVCAAKT